ncbi:ferritin-like domain-containing protein [Candidatus Bathyarchaeota archaeon]|jgi:rubrerythrin|nr:MAG: ferritin-like domain-containing protein [Candidatus Bathyarchaeota archaeon]
MVDEKLTIFLESMIEAEKAIVKSVEESLEELGNYAVEAALKGISLDSMKHAMLYGSALAILTETRTPLDETQLERQRDLVERHITMEGRVIARLEEMIPRVENEKVSFILETIIADERRHHKVLLNVQELLVRGETVTEEDWWDAVWGDVPGLWA